MEKNEHSPAPDISVGDWMITLLIAAIPLVNIIMLFVWAFGSGYHTSKANWAKATLIWALISIVIAVILMILFGAVIFSFMNSGPDFYENPQF
ncbi:hypothetical protein DSECCO2_202510 [anaerobic digester metagenome]|jgi:uncharacterized BrkB/YihY/UPF0761 family membrane protein